tara:strand:+ start:270 stop:1178 length:909 start_codon:yes stop_codon:yes gene_type:complete
MIHNDGLGDLSIKMLIDNREEVRDRLKRQLLTGRRVVSASDNPDLYHTVNDLESKIDISEKSLKNFNDAADLVSLYGKAIPHLIEILQKMITITLDTRQAGLTNNLFYNNLLKIDNLASELKSAILLYKFKNMHIFFYKLVNEISYTVETRFKWDISDNILKRTCLTFNKPRMVIGENLLYKVSLNDSNCYKTTNNFTVNNNGNRNKLSYNILVLENDVKRLQRELDTVNSFSENIKAKRRLLLTTLDNNYRMLRDAVGVDKSEIQTKIDSINHELKTARDTWRTSSLNDPITNTITSLLEI